MKKLLSLVCAIFLSFGMLFADSSCRVYGSDGNVASIDYPAQTVNQYGQISAWVELTKEATTPTTVVVEVWYNGDVIATRTVTVSRGYKRACTQEISLGRDMAGKRVKLSIASATCQ